MPIAYYAIAVIVAAGIALAFAVGLSPSSDSDEPAGEELARAEDTVREIREVAPPTADDEEDRQPQEQVVVPQVAPVAAAPDDAPAEPAPEEAPAEAAGQGGQDNAAVPEMAQLAILIRSTLIALNQAGQSDDYSVLHALAAPEVREGASPADLREVFGAFREHNIDLGPVAVINPTLTRQPAIDEAGALQVAGAFPTRPQQIAFELAFKQADGRWRWRGIRLDFVAPDEAAAPDGAGTADAAATQ